MRLFVIFMCTLGAMAGFATIVRDGFSTLVVTGTIVSFCSVIYNSAKK
jgi:hypothetical protein